MVQVHIILINKYRENTMNTAIQHSKSGCIVSKDSRGVLSVIYKTQDRLPFTKKERKKTLQNGPKSSYSPQLILLD